MTRVLLIEPDPALRDRLALCLHRAHYSVRSAADAVAGLNTAQEWSPDVVITPLDLKCADGSGVVTTLRTLPLAKHAGVVALLTEGHTDVRAALLAGADDAITAPFTEAGLLEAVRARERRAATIPSPAEAPDGALEGMSATLRSCSRPVTIALVALQDAHALAAVAGPEALKEFSTSWRARVHALASDAASVFTIGPGEVALVLPPNTPQLRPLLAAIAGTGQIPIHANGTEYRARAAIGTTVVDHDTPVPSAAMLLRQCRFALDLAREGGHPQVRDYDAADARSTLDDLALATLIQRAAEQGRFQLVYQPIVAIPTGIVTAVEALIRWNMPTGESVAPERLLAVADEAGLLDEVGTWALREACRQAARWSQDGLHIAVNVNAASGQFRRGDFVDEARMALSESGLQGEQLLVEVSESTLARDSGSIRDQLSEIRVSGIRVSIEDVGAGALALPTLRSLPVDELKVDRSLTRRLPGNAQDRAAADLVLREAHELNVPCVAEGVEHGAQWAYLSERGWNAAQGYLISHPLAADAIPEFALQAERGAHAHKPDTRTDVTR